MATAATKYAMKIQENIDAGLKSSTASKPSQKKETKRIKFKIKLRKSKKPSIDATEIRPSQNVCLMIQS